VAFGAFYLIVRLCCGVYKGFFHSWAGGQSNPVQQLHKLEGEARGCRDSLLRSYAGISGDPARKLHNGTRSTLVWRAEREKRAVGHKRMPPHEGLSPSGKWLRYSRAHKSATCSIIELECQIFARLQQKVEDLYARFSSGDVSELVQAKGKVATSIKFTLQHSTAFFDLCVQDCFLKYIISSPRNSSIYVVGGKLV